MRYVLLFFLLGLAIAVDLGVFIARSDEALVSFNPLRPATLIPIVANRLHTLHAQVRELDARALFDALTGRYRELGRREGMTPSAP